MPHKRLVTSICFCEMWWGLPKDDVGEKGAEGKVWNHNESSRLKKSDLKDWRQFIVQATVKRASNIARVSVRVFITHIMGILGHKRYFQSKPTRGKFSTCMELAQIFAQLKQSFSTVWPPPPTGASSSCFVIIGLYCADVVRQLNGFLASWLDLAVPFGHSPMQVWFWLELAWVGSTVWPGLSFP